MAKQILKAELARQNDALRAELSQLKADYKRLEIGLDWYKEQYDEAQRAETGLDWDKPAKPLTRAQLMAHAKQVAVSTGCVTQIRDGAVQVKQNGGWVTA